MDEITDRYARARSFGPAARQYDRVRPGYPEPALRWALGDRPLRVVDLGAGTGILSRQLAALGHEVVPVEPDEGMRERLSEASAGLRPLAGTAERIPLPDASVDAVTAGQSYHWFDPEPAHTEIARVLRPGGVFAPLWNMRDDSVPWVVTLSRITNDDTAGSGGGSSHRRLSFGPWFASVARAEFRHHASCTVDALVALLATWSCYLTASPERQHRLTGRVRELCASHPDLAGRERFDLPYVTAVYRALRSG